MTRCIFSVRYSSAYPFPDTAPLLLHRLPYYDLDYRIMELAFQIPQRFKYRNFSKKYILKDLAFEMVPKSLLDRPQKGFGVLQADWMRTKLHGKLLRYADAEILKRQGTFHAEKIHEFSHCLEKSDKSLYNSVLWSFYVF